LVKALNLSRSRLQKFADGEIDVDNLTVKEYKALFANAIETNIFIEIKRGNTNELLSIYKIRFETDKIKEGVSMFYKYIREPNLSIGCIAGVPFGNSNYHF
tara:strand:- start:102 stop:404 length:303 start_codon:yes stop_codon:yes gene_type:complete